MTRTGPGRPARRLRRLVSLVLGLLVLVVPAASLGAVGDRGDRAGPFVGIDGLLYDLAPSVVLGLGEQKFYGPDFDLACGYGHELRAGMRNLSELARIISASGRRVVFTVAPNKSTALAGQVDPAQLPHGNCDQVGLAQQRHLLESYRDPHYLALPARLARDHRQTYWNTDLHWTTVGASDFAQALATQLDTRLGREQAYRAGTEVTALGGLNALLHIPDPETVPTAVPEDGVRVSPREVRDPYDHTWRSLPQKRTWPGRTVVIGDSMMAIALSTLRPMFRHGRFLWLQHVPTEELVSAIASADTVVFETVQLFVPVVELGTEQFRNQVRAGLRGHS